MLIQPGRGSPGRCRLKTPAPRLRPFLGSGRRLRGRRCRRNRGCRRPVDGISIDEKDLLSQRCMVAATTVLPLQFIQRKPAMTWPWETGRSSREMSVS
jgi:hypothetical protein